jgi:hypothetical protein
MVGAMTELTTAPEATQPTTRPERRFAAPTKSAPPPSGGAVYGLGMIGALAYFLGTAGSGTDYVLAFGKAVVWPAILVYRAFKVLGG